MIEYQFISCTKMRINFFNNSQIFYLWMMLNLKLYFSKAGARSLHCGHRLPGKRVTLCLALDRRQASHSQPDAGQPGSASPRDGGFSLQSHRSIRLKRSAHVTRELFSPSIWWMGSRKHHFGSDIHILPMYL